MAGTLTVLLTVNAAVSRGRRYPDILGVEMLAQAAVTLVAAPGGAVGAGGAGQGRLAGIDGARWHRVLSPGERLRARVELVGRFQRLVKVRAVLETESGEVALEADLSLAMVG